MTQLADERLRRWRLILGGEDADGIGISLHGTDLGMDNVLHALYDAGGEGEGGKDGKSKTRQGGLGSSAPNVARWLGDIRTYFPTPVVRLMQQDALERLDLKQMLLEPELLAEVEPDVHLVGTLLALKSILPGRTKETARLVVRRVIEDLTRKLANPLRQAVTGSLNRAARNRRPRHNEMDWNRTIRANLKHYQREYHTIIPETRLGFGHKRAALREVILCVDQSGSMATSVVYAGVCGAVLASLPTLSTRVVVFDTAVVDLTEELDDPVELLFGTQLGGGTDINQALTYCQSLVKRPHDTILVLLSDLYEGGNREEMLKRAASLVASGVQVIALLALNDDGAPSYDHHVAAALASLDIPAFACTPDLFPDLMAAALNRQNMIQWAARHDLVLPAGQTGESRY